MQYRVVVAVAEIWICACREKYADARDPISHRIFRVAARGRSRGRPKSAHASARLIPSTSPLLAAAMINGVGITDCNL